MTDLDRRPAYTRRVFLQQGLTMASLSAAVPAFLQDSAMAIMRPLGSMLTSQPGVPEDRVLVVVQLGGGNDGLNTVVPYGDEAYHRARPQLRVAEPGRGQNAALPLDDVDGLGLHPGLAELKALLDDGAASIVQGVGYPNPNRSHFASMDIWHTASLSGNGTGWLGRYYDNTCDGCPQDASAIAIGRTAPRALLGDDRQPVAFQSAELYRWAGADLHDHLEDAHRSLLDASPAGPADDGGQLDFLHKTALDARVSSSRVRAAVARQPLVRYPGNALARQLRVVGAMIREGLPTRVYYVSLGGFDTHAGQAPQHAGLMRQFSSAVAAFQEDLAAQGNQDRVLTMVFSEFGRRVAQNASGGTDHGTAAPMFLLGPMVRPGVLGRHPSLTDLDEGDLKFTVDFRSVYAGVLHDWLGADDRAILGGRFRRAKLLADAAVAGSGRG